MAFQNSLDRPKPVSTHPGKTQRNFGRNSAPTSAANGTASANAHSETRGTCFFFGTNNFLFGGNRDNKARARLRAAFFLFSFVPFILFCVLFSAVHTARKESRPMRVIDLRFVFCSSISSLEFPVSDLDDRSCSRKPRDRASRRLSSRWSSPFHQLTTTLKILPESQLFCTHSYRPAQSASAQGQSPLILPLDFRQSGRERRLRRSRRERIPHTRWSHA